MDSELANLTKQLQAHLPITDKDLTEVIRAIRWWEEARHQTPLAAVLLYVRVLELLAQRAGVDKWYVYLDQYHRPWWIRTSMLHDLYDVIDDCIANDQLVADPADQAWLRQFGNAVTTYQPGGYMRDARQALAELPKLAGLFPVHHPLYRRIRDAASRCTLSGLPTWYEELAVDWDLTRERLVALRNALAHAGPIEDSASATVHMFVEQLAAQALSVALQGLLDGIGVVAANAAYKQRSDQWSGDLSSAGSVIDALIGKP